MAIVVVKIGEFHYTQGDGKRTHAKQNSVLTEGNSGEQIPASEVARGAALGAFWSSKAAAHAAILASPISRAGGFEGGLANAEDPGP